MTLLRLSHYPCRPGVPVVVWLHPRLARPEDFRPFVHIQSTRSVRFDSKAWEAHSFPSVSQAKQNPRIASQLLCYISYPCYFQAFREYPRRQNSPQSNANGVLPATKVGFHRSYNIYNQLVRAVQDTSSRRNLTGIALLDIGIAFDLVWYNSFRFKIMDISFLLLSSNGYQTLPHVRTAQIRNHQHLLATFSV